MTFSQHGYAEWHSMATYKDFFQFETLFDNYLKDHKNQKNPDETDPNKHLLQIDLAIYDENEWEKIMFQIDSVKQA